VLLPSQDRRIHRHTHPTILLFLRVLVAAGTCLPGRCLATLSGIHTQTDEGFTKYAFKMALGAIVYITDIIKIGSAIEKLIWGEGFIDGIMIA
jgi:hypothetical protein